MTLSVFRRRIGSVNEARIIPRFFFGFYPLIMRNKREFLSGVLIKAMSDCRNVLVAAGLRDQRYFIGRNVPQLRAMRRLWTLVRITVSSNSDGIGMRKWSLHSREKIKAWLTYFFLRYALCHEMVIGLFGSNFDEFRFRWHRHAKVILMFTQKNRSAAGAFFCSHYALCHETVIDSGLNSDEYMIYLLFI